MSPEPTQEPIEENLKAPDVLVTVREGSDSESEDEENRLAGYIPLSQVPTDTDLILDEDEDNEWILPSGESNQGVPAPPVESSNKYPSERIEVWSSAENRSNIEMDAEKINQVKSMMASFTLPTTAFPEWANTVSEEQWKEQLMKRIKEMQSKDKEV